MWDVCNWAVIVYKGIKKTDSDAYNKTLFNNCFQATVLCFLM